MTNVTTVEDDNNVHYTSADRFESLNVSTKVNFDEYLVLIIGIDHDATLFKEFPNFLSKDLLQEFPDFEAIHSLRSTNIFLIISNELDKKQVDEFVSKHRIIGIYIYCKTQDNHTKCMKRKRTMETELLTKLHRDINLMSHQWSFKEKSFQKAFTNTSQWYHLFLTIICYRSKYSEEYYEEMFNECRSYYSDNNRMIEEINKLQKNYDECNLIYEYTRNNFLYRIINHALRTQNMETIKIFGPFINDLISQLAKYNQKYFTSNEFPIRAVYRGQYLSSDELKFLRSVWKSNKPIITLTTFGSTSLDPEVAMDFSAYYSDDLIPCLFEIVLTDEYNQNRKDMHSIYPYDLYGNISCDSAIKDEQEILFSPGIHFRIESVEDPIYHFDRQWTPIKLVIVMEADGKSFFNYVNIAKQIQKTEDPQVYNDILDMLQINAENEIRFQQSNWDKWWNALKRQWGTNYINIKRQSLNLTFYNCFSNDFHWSRKAIEMYKTKLQFISEIQSNCSSFSYLFKTYISWRELPTIWLALYEDYLKPFCQNTDNEEVFKCLCFAGELYEKIAGYEYALECYENALQINIKNKYNKDNQIQKQIGNIKRAIQRKSDVRRQSKKNIVTIDQQEKRHQWFVYRVIKQYTPDRSSILSVLRQIFEYMTNREEAYDLFYTKIIFSFPFEVTTDLSNDDYYLNFFLALQKHLLNDLPSSANNSILSLWRYEKSYSEWVRFQSLEIFLRPFEKKLDFLRTNFLPRLKRFLQKLTTILVICFFYICVKQIGDQIIVNNVLLTDNSNKTKTTQPMDLSNSEMKHYLDTLDNQCSINDQTSITIPNHERFDEDQVRLFFDSLT